MAFELYSFQFIKIIIYVFKKLLTHTIEFFKKHHLFGYRLKSKEWCDAIKYFIFSIYYICQLLYLYIYINGGSEGREAIGGSPPSLRVPPY